MKKTDRIVDKNAFLDMVRQNDLKPLEIVPNGISLSVQLACDEETFLKIASAKTSEIFYFYEYPQDCEILITGETIENANGRLSELIKFLNISEDFIYELDREIYPYENDDEDEDEIEYSLSSLERKIEKEILSQNAQVDRKGLTIPRRFMAFYIDGGCLVGICKKVEAPLWSVAEENLYSILNKYRDIVERNMEAAAQTKTKTRDKFKEYLLNDIQFKISSNQKLRTEYARNLWFNPEFKWIKDGFEKTRGFPSNEYFNFIERVYKEMKYVDKP